MEFARYVFDFEHYRASMSEVVSIRCKSARRSHGKTTTDSHAKRTRNLHSIPPI